MINNNRSRFGGDLVDFNRRFDAFRTDLGDNPFMRQPSSSRDSLNQAVFGPVPSNDPISAAPLNSNLAGSPYSGLDRRFTDSPQIFDLLLRPARRPSDIFPDNSAQSLGQVYEPSSSDTLFSYSLFALYTLVFLVILIFLIVLIATVYESSLTRSFKIFRIFLRFFQLCKASMSRFSGYFANSPLSDLFSLQDITTTDVDPFLTRLLRNTRWVFSEIGGFLYRNGFRSFMTLTSLFFGPFLFKYRKKYKKLGSSFWRRWLGR